MKAKLLRDAGKITEGTEVEIASRAGTNEIGPTRTWRTEHHCRAGLRGERQRGNAEKVDTRDLKPLP